MANYSLLITDHEWYNIPIENIFKKYGSLRGAYIENMPNFIISLNLNLNDNLYKYITQQNINDNW